METETKPEPEEKVVEETKLQEEKLTTKNILEQAKQKIKSKKVFQKSLL